MVFVCVPNRHWGGGEGVLTGLAQHRDTSDDESTDTESERAAEPAQNKYYIHQ